MIPLSIFELSSSARIHLIPMMVCLNKRFRVGKKLLPNLNHIAGGGGEWFREDRSPLFQTLLSDVKQIISYPLSLHHKGYEEVERFMKERIDENGTLYSYATASFYMIYALLALGHSPQSSLIQKAIAGITSYIWKMERGVTCKTLLQPYGIQLYSAMRYKRPTFRKIIKCFKMQQHIY